MIPASIIFVWTGTNGSIPSGWERETLLDGYFPKGALFNNNPGITGGAATHTHSSVTTHTHSDTHIHTISFGVSGASGTGRVGTGTNVNAHIHANINSGAVSGGSLSSVSSTYLAYSNEPPYRKVIFIKPSSPVSGLAEDGVCFVDSSNTLGFTFCDGNNSTPDLRNKYLKGAGTGEDADVSNSFGSLTNVHELSHTHTVSAHTHASATSGQRTTGDACVTNTGTGYASTTHTHSVTLASTTVTLVAGNPTLTTTNEVEPSFYKILPVQNKTGNPLEKVGMIGMWLGSTNSIPSGWVEFSAMRGKHLKCANTTSEANTTGGSNTHTHDNQNHTHTANSHTHSSPTTVSHDSTKARSDNNVPAVRSNDTHALTKSTVTGVYSNSATAAQSSSNEPEYKTVNFIKLVSIVSGGAFIFNLL